MNFATTPNVKQALSCRSPVFLSVTGRALPRKHRYNLAIRGRCVSIILGRASSRARSWPVIPFNRRDTTRGPRRLLVAVVQRPPRTENGPTPYSDVPRCLGSDQSANLCASSFLLRRGKYGIHSRVGSWCSGGHTGCDLSVHPSPISSTPRCGPSLLGWARIRARRLTLCDQEIQDRLVERANQGRLSRGGDVSVAAVYVKGRISNHPAFAICAHNNL